MTQTVVILQKSHCYKDEMAEPAGAFFALNLRIRCPHPRHPPSLLIACWQRCNHGANDLFYLRQSRRRRVVNAIGQKKQITTRHTQNGLKNYFTHTHTQTRTRTSTHTVHEHTICRLEFRDTVFTFLTSLPLILESFF